MVLVLYFLLESFSINRELWNIHTFASCQIKITESSFKFSHWFPCGVDRQTIELMHGHTKFHFVITTISLFFFQESKHHLCLRLQDFSMWCFSCHSEVQPSDGSSGSANSETTSSPRPKVHLTSST